MRFVIQRVKKASVTVYEEDTAGKVLPEGKVTGSIEKGYMVLVGACQSDTKEIADIMISGTDMKKLLTFKQLSDRLIPRMKNTAGVGIAFNAAILVAGLAGLVTPGTAALLHNASTIGLCLRNMTPLVEMKKDPADAPDPCVEAMGLEPMTSRV